MLHYSLKNHSGFWMITCEFLIVRYWLKSVISVLTINKKEVKHLDIVISKSSDTYQILIHDWKFLLSCCLSLLWNL